MSITTAVIVIVVFLALDIVFYYLIIRSMERPSPSAAFARARALSTVPDSEQESLGKRLRQHLPIPGGDLFDIVRLDPAGTEGYLFTTQPQADSHLPRSRENQRQFIAVLLKLPVDGRLFIHCPIRRPFAGFKRRRLFRVFKTDAFMPVPDDALPRALFGRYQVQAERTGSALQHVLTAEVTSLLAIRAPRARGFALLVCPGGLAVYINPMLTDRQEAAKFYEFVRELVGALAKRG